MTDTEDEASGNLNLTTTITGDLIRALATVSDEDWEKVKKRVVEIYEVFADAMNRMNNV